MGKIINAFLALIAYVCVATVITLALIVGWCWHTDRLNSEKMFRLTALLQDVDLQQIAEADRSQVDPPIQVEAATWWPAGQLDWWVKEHRPRLEWWGRARGVDGRRRWVKAADLRPASRRSP